MFNFKI